MAQPGISGSDNQRGALSGMSVLLLKAWGVVVPIICALVWMAFGLSLFVQIRAWGVAYDRKMGMIERGEVRPETLCVMELSKDKEHGWHIAMGKNGKAVAWRTDSKIEGIQVGSTVAAYRFGDTYLIPRFDRGGFHWAKWVFLVVALLPLPIVGGVLLFQIFRRRSVVESPSNIPVTKAFSLASMSFDRVPDDSQLVCLLGDPDCGPVQEVEEGGLLTVRPWLFPLKLVVPWLVFTLFAITGVALCFLREQGVLMWLFLAFGWFLCLPAIWGLLAVVNCSLTKKGDYFKVDMARRTLELCRAGRTLKRGEIIAITLLTRWYAKAGSGHKTHQTGVLVRTRDNQIELFPVVRELAENVPASKRSKWADRLASVFQVPIRQVELSRSESRALNDC
jgi:hypothetical protein